jgi:membrane protein YqaA with SNARE-associated domain
MTDILILGGLFFSSLLAATIFPAQSEALLAGLHIANTHPTWLLLATASSGNILGSIINWLLGFYFTRFQEKKWFPIKEFTFSKATLLYQKYGVWALLFAWVPFIGDCLTIIAGIFRTNILLFIILVTIGKVGRYALLLYIL